MSSCTTSKRCAKKFPLQTVTIIKDSIREVITYRDTTIFIQLDPITVTKTDTVYIKNGVIQFKEITAESNSATGRAGIRQNRLYLVMMDKDTTITITIKNALKEVEFWQSKYNNEKQTVEVKFIPKFWKVTGWVGIVSILLFALWLVKKFMI